MTRPTVFIAVTNNICSDRRMIKTSETLEANGWKTRLIGRKYKKKVNPNPEKIEFHRFSMFFSTGILFYLEYQLRLFGYLLFHKSDILISVDLDTFLPCFLISKIRKTKLILDCHELFPEVPELVNRPFRKKIWEWVEKMAFYYCPNIYTVSESISTYYFKKYGRTIPVIYNFPKNNSLPQKTIEFPEKHILIYLGDLNMGRGLEQIISAMVKIDAELWIAGEGKLAEQLILQVNERNLNHKVRFLGTIKPDDIFKTLSKASIGLNLLENKGLSYYYSAANKFFDYAAAGVPSITMAFPEYNNLLNQHKTGLAIEKLDEDSILKAFEELNQPDLYKELLSNCLKASEKWNWEHQESKIIWFFNNL